MTNPPAYQYYAADFDEDTASWDCEEVGIYQRLLNYEWINGALPNEPVRLARIARISSKKFAKRWEIISPKFSQNGEGFLVNRRMEEEREIQRQYRESQSESGKRGVEKKRKEGIFPFDKSSDPSTDPSSNPATENQALQSSSSSSIKDKKEDIQIPLRDGSDFQLAKDKIQEYEKTFLNINVEHELRMIRQWNIDNPGKRKTRAKILRHINNWLTDTANKRIESQEKPKGNQGVEYQGQPWSEVRKEHE